MVDEPVLSHFLFHLSDSPQVGIVFESHNLLLQVSHLLLVGQSQLVGYVVSILWNVFFKFVLFLLQLCAFLFDLFAEYFNGLALPHNLLS